MPILLIALVITGLWDGFTTFYGTQLILGDSNIQLVASAAFAVIITGFLFGTKTVWSDIDSAFFAIVLRLMWVTAFGYDIYTSYIGNRDIILSGADSTEKIAILVGMTVLVSGSPIVFSYLKDE